MHMKHLKGIGLSHNKNTENVQTERMPVPKHIVVPMSMHFGAPCEPTVSVGDYVYVGQVIGDSKEFFSVPIHSGVSGTVTKIGEITMSSSARVKTIEIDSDGLQKIDAEIVPPTVTTHKELVDALRKSGLVGLGGAGFPTFIKLNPKNLDEIDTLIVNAAECEPYITSDCRTIIEDMQHVLDGIAVVVKYLNIKNVYITVEDNKAQAIKVLKDSTKNIDYIKIRTLPSKYPKGAEKVIIYETCGRVVGEGKLPADCGVIVLNIATTAFISKYLKTGMPLVEKRLTVDGSAVANPKNVFAIVGTPFRDIIDFCGGYKKEPKKMLMGGPMMGIAIINDQYPLLKNNNAVLALAEEDVSDPEETACIRCGRCVRACPLDLMPNEIDRAYYAKDIALLQKLKVNLCMECGSCAYVCPSKRYLVMNNRLAKKMLREASKK